MKPAVLVHAAPVAFLLPLLFGVLPFQADDDPQWMDAPRESFAHKTCNLLIEACFEVCLVRIGYVGTDRRERIATRLAFLVENADLLARRKCSEACRKRQSP